ncbi:MAG TPA: heavy metal-binding domain-containing protein [Microbacterium sp.]|jgi:hypothetical protein|nr:heavy metal-binding domain-containing protein [Microbacterium sp.]|tara:strand:- start:28316 stop:29275 length:960 start_codon:yes stop_codon:yes gene_type:complete
MNAAGRLGLYAAGVAVAFGGAFLTADAVVPDSVVADWTAAAEQGSMNDHTGMGSDDAETATIPGVALSGYGYQLSPISAPTETGERGELSFQVLAADGAPLTAYETAHEKDLHLIAVRTDGTQFRHVHPTFDEATSTWSTSWEWAEAGTYRIYADFAPDVTDGPDKVTLTRTVDVAGAFTPDPATATSTTSEVDGYTVTLDGDLTAGESSELTLSVTRDGQPVTTLQPYLGAFGHLVALRDGDLAYLHVHAEGDEPRDGDTAGPDIRFAAEAPTAGRYLLYLDFQVDGQVPTAEFVVDAGHGTGGTDTDDTHSDTGDGH